MTKLSDTCNWLTGSGILKELTSNFDVPWKESVDGQTLDDDYYGNHSGNKPISNLAEKLLDSNGKLDSTSTNRLAQIIYDKYNSNWNKVWVALLAEYNPIENYNMVEEETPAETTTTQTPAETTITDTPAETTTTDTPAETTTTETPAETTTTETRQDLNAALTDSGILRSETKTFPVERKTTTTENGQKEDELTFTNRKDQLSKSGTEQDARSYGDGYIVEERGWGKSYTQERINSFNDGLITSKDSETLNGVGNGPDGAGGTPSGPTGDSNNGTWHKETGGYTDTKGYTDYLESSEKLGSEKHTIKTTGPNGSGKYTTEVVEAGSELVENIEKDRTRWQTETKYENNNDKVIKQETDAAGSQEITVQSPAVTKYETDKAGTTVYTTQNNRVLTRSGNIGVTTNQQMLTQEMLFRLNNNMFDTLVYKDIDKVMCQQFYSNTETNLY